MFVVCPLEREQGQAEVFDGLEAPHPQEIVLAQAEGTIGEFFRKMARPAGFEPATLEIIHTDDAVQDSALESRDRAKGGPVLAHGKRLSIGDLLQAGLIREGDQWRLSLKGEVIWGRIESNGQLEVSNQSHGNPSKAFQAATGKPGNGWYYWHSRAASGEWQRIDALRSEYRRHVGTAKLALVQDATPDTA